MDTRDNAPLIAAAGGLLLFISLFLNWVGYEGIDSVSGWEFFDIIDVLLALIALLAVAIGVGIFTGNPINPPGGPGPAVYTAGLVAFTVVAVHILDPFTLEGESVDREFGLLVALLGTLGIIVGGLQMGRGAPAAPRTRVSEPPPPPPSSPPPPPPASPTV